MRNYHSTYGIRPGTGQSVMESMQQMGHDTMEKVKEMTGMGSHATAPGTTTGTMGYLKPSIVGAQHPGMMESAKQGVEHMVERGKEMLGKGKQTAEEAYEQSKHASEQAYEDVASTIQKGKESSTGAWHGAKEGAQAGFESGVAQH